MTLKQLADYLFKNNLISSFTEKKGVIKCFGKTIEGKDIICEKLNGDAVCFSGDIVANSDSNAKYYSSNGDTSVLIDTDSLILAKNDYKGSTVPNGWQKKLEIK